LTVIRSRVNWCCSILTGHEHGVDNRIAAALVILLAVITAAPSFGSVPTLFQDHEPVEMELAADWGALCRNEDLGVCESLPATLSYVSASAERVTLSVEVRARGGWRRVEMRCTYPPLFIDFSTQEVEGTLFEGQFSLPLTTHCFSRRIDSVKNVLKEYLAYRIYRLFSEKSISARLARVTYRDKSAKTEPKPFPAFFTEHFESVAARNNSKLFQASYISAALLDPMESTTLALFQYLIGNTDWSMITGHNTVPLRARDGTVSILPFDFDFSGLVNARYAGPPPKLPIRRVTQRLYRGFCYPGLDWDSAFRPFIGRKAQVFGLTDEIAEWSESSARQARSFIEGFYSTLESPKKRRKRIEESCRPLYGSE
jgi:hypothetical protein